MNVGYLVVVKSIYKTIPVFLKLEENARTQRETAVVSVS